MTTLAIADELTAGALAWVADRLTLAELEPEHRQWLENIARHLDELLPLNDDGELEQYVPDNVAEELDELKVSLDVTTRTLRTVGEALGLDLEVVDDLEALRSVLVARLEHEREEGHKDAIVQGRQDARSKALRLLIEGRLDVTRHDTFGPHAGLIVASCRGDSGSTYDLGYDPHHKQWRCTCAELRGNCSHLHALKMVTTVNPTTGDRR